MWFDSWKVFIYSETSPRWILTGPYKYSTKDRFPFWTGSTLGKFYCKRSVYYRLFGALSSLHIIMNHAFLTQLHTSRSSINTVSHQLKSFTCTDQFITTNDTQFEPIWHAIRTSPYAATKKSENKIYRHSVLQHIATPWNLSSPGLGCVQSGGEPHAKSTFSCVRTVVVSIWCSPFPTVLSPRNTLHWWWFYGAHEGDGDDDNDDDDDDDIAPMIDMQRLESTKWRCRRVEKMKRSAHTPVASIHTPFHGISVDDDDDDNSDNEEYTASTRRHLY